ncbi:aspartate/glutamate racemase family protein [Devosia sp.]|uniref:aspartate/glutamate racemase family protein n=1 Tax=Devosia sp. TaxID=1871048 RepID=UPI002F084922
MTGPRIALIHALEESVAPARAAFGDVWPGAYCFDLLDTSLAADRAQAGRLDEAMTRRFRALAGYAEATSGCGGSTAAILFTCSAFGPAIDAARLTTPIPVLRPNEAAFAEALELGSRVLLAVTFGPSQDALKDELQAMARAAGKSIEVETVLIDGALAALQAGDGERHDALAAECVGRRAAGADVIILGQFSLARARPLVEARVGPIQVITTPHSAARAIRRLVGEAGSPRRTQGPAGGA